MTCAKGLTSGYVPMGAVVVSDRVKEPFFGRGLERDVPPRLHLRRPPGGLRGRASRISRSSSARAWSSACASSSRCSPRPIRSASTAHPMVGRGALVRPAARRSSSRPRHSRRRRGLADVVSDLALEHGLIGRGLRGVAMQVSPPFVVTEDEIAEMARRLRAGRRRRHAAPARRRREQSTVRLTPREVERLLLFQAAELARRRRGARPAAQPGRGDRADRRRGLRGRARRPRLRRGRGARLRACSARPTCSTAWRRSCRASRSRRSSATACD